MKNSFKNKKVLVTGAAGFIGSHLTEMLLKGGAHVTALVRYTSSGRSGWLEYLPPLAKSRLNIIHGDVRDPDLCQAAVKGNDYIFHLAAQVAIPYSYIAPRDFLAVNAVGTANMLQAARAEKVKKFLQVSTSEVYGTAQYTPIDEKHPQVAQSPYAASKIAADKMVQSFYHSFGMPVVTVRPFNCYGPRQSARAVIPTIILQALHGKTIKLGNINSSRDLNFVSDIASGMINACFTEKTAGMTMNLASGRDYPIRELVNIIGDILSKKLLIKTEKRRVRPMSSEVWRLVGNSALANKMIGYKSTHSIQVGLKKTVEFFEKHIDMYAKEDYQP
ncbi:MAG: SDR family NAD(P)-dependent oxidoreductase [Candidatus Zixiibacteriota bacterium]